MSPQTVAILVAFALALVAAAIALFFRLRSVRLANDIENLRQSVAHLYQYEEIHDAKREAEAIRNDALKDTARQLAEAEKAREEVAKDAERWALAAKQSRDIATAMKNVIEGYGDEYIVPSQSVLGADLPRRRCSPTISTTSLEKGCSSGAPQAT